MLGLFRSRPVPVPEGSLDVVTPNHVEGWAAIKGDRRPVTVMLWVDDECQSEALASAFRADLAAAGINEGNHGFSIPLPESARDGRSHAISIKVGETLIARRDDVRISGPLTPEAFDRDRPWLDFDLADFQRELAARVADGRLSAQLAEDLVSFRENGFLWLRDVIPDQLIEKTLADVESAWDTQPAHLLVLNRNLKQPTAIAQVAGTDGIRNTSMRYLDFHNFSDAAAEIMLHPRVTSFIAAYLDAAIVSMQSLLFENGTEQSAHQDFPYVHTLSPALLAGAWVALEDVHPDAGPLFYYPGSHHRVRKHVFPNGTVLAEGDGPHVRAFEAYLQAECDRLQLPRTVFAPKKGDVLIWHSALVHGGSPRLDRSRTRKSIVFHYSTREAYPFDRRHPMQAPRVIERHGQVYYGMQHEGHREGCFPLRADP